MTVKELRKFLVGRKPNAQVIFQDGLIEVNPPMRKPYKRTIKPYHEKALYFHSLGLGPTEIARRIGRSKQSVDQWLKAHFEHQSKMEGNL